MSQPVDIVYAWSRVLTDANIPGDISRRLVNKMVKGCIKYGTWDPNKKDDRNYRREALEELYDAMNYAIMGALTSQESQKNEYERLLIDLGKLVKSLRR